MGEICAELGYLASMRRIGGDILCLPSSRHHALHTRREIPAVEIGLNRVVDMFQFCDDSDVDREQERELRQWAGALSDVAGREQRAMGRAILMLLEQISLLRAELDQRSSLPEPDEIGPAPALDDVATSEVEADATPLEDATVFGLRDRLRTVAHRGRY